jgi:peptidoglycan/xylan/chitin deacetylase (PgdA/CDA1 family)
MIALFGHDDYSVMGITSILDIEKIPYRRLPALKQCPGELLLVAAAELSAEELACVERQPALVLNGGLRFARALFGASAPSARIGGCAISLDEPIWPADVRQLAAGFGKESLHLPLAPVCETRRIARGTTVAALSPSPSLEEPHCPAVVQLNRCVWSAIDLGAAFANLLTEQYLPERSRPGRLSARPRLQRLAEGAYYAAPEFLRRWVQRRSYAELERRLQNDGEQVSDYPIDATGWLLIELVKTLIRLAAGALVRLERWPAPYRAASALTHDLEPRPYAYTRGLGRLLGRIDDNGHPAALGLVTAASARYLEDKSIAQMARHEIICHGLEHRGEASAGRSQLIDRMQTARARLEWRLQRRINGYRSPRLDRSSDLAWALDQSEFQYDSSYPDVDRENLSHFGAGVRVNVPYRPPIEEERDRFRYSRCLELPLTAPDCIQPLFAGADVATLRATVASKAEFVLATGGLYVALVHGGVFGERDADTREAHLDFVCGQLRQTGFWMAGVGQIVEWWRCREALRVSVRDGEVHVVNTGYQPVTGVRVVVEDVAGNTVIPLPPLAAGGEVAVGLPGYSSPLLRQRASSVVSAPLAWLTGQSARMPSRLTLVGGGASAEALPAAKKRGRRGWRVLDS